MAFSVLVHSTAFCKPQGESIFIGKRSLEIFCGFSSRLKNLWSREILEDLFDKLTECEEEEGPPCKKIHLEDKPSTSSHPLDPTLPTTPSSKIEIAFPINEGSLHDSGISQDFYPFKSSCPTEKQFISVVFNVDIVLRAEPLFVHILVKSTSIPC